MGLDMYLFLEDKETKEKHEFSYGATDITDQGGAGLRGRERH